MLSWCAGCFRRSTPTSVTNKESTQWNKSFRANRSPRAGEAGARGTGKAFLVFKIVMFVIFLIYAISLLYPILFGFLSSLKTQSEYSNAPTALPVEWLFSNYIDAFVELSADGADMFTMRSTASGTRSAVPFSAFLFP